MRVLIVDDECYVREIVGRWLTDAGHVCATAASALAAWEHLSREAADLVTLDVMMPGRSGLQLLREIRHTYPEMAVIMLTALGNTDAAIEALTHGAWGYLLKPVKRAQLIEEVDVVLQRRAAMLGGRDYTALLEEKVRDQAQVIQEAREEVVQRLVNASMCRDEETGAHIVRTGLCSALIAAAADWPPAQVAQLRIAAPMHDLGKIGIPDAILRKPGRLNEEEFEVMKTHTILGAQMLAASADPTLQVAQQIALGHHERWNGSGYPAGLAGEAIPGSARIVAIVDVYDALRHTRVYRAALTPEHALAIMHEGRGTHFDPHLLDAFLKLLPEIDYVMQDHPDAPATACRSDHALGPQWPLNLLLPALSA